MADFLSRLIERTMGVAPMVEPIIAPRYAREQHRHQQEMPFQVIELEDDRPPTEGTLSGGQVTLTGVGFIAPSSWDAESTHTDPLQRSQQESPHTGLVPPQGEELQPSQAKSPAAPPALRPAGPQNSPLNIRFTHLLKSTVLNEPGAAEVETPVGILPVGSHGHPVQENLPLPSSPVQDAQALFPASHRGASGDSLLHTHPTASMVSTAGVHLYGNTRTSAEVPLVSDNDESPPGIHRHHVHSHSQEQLASKTLPPSAEASLAAPTIQVTIGRIEVRATLPPAAPRAQSPTQGAVSSLMSLDQYLQQRGKGGH